MDKRATLRALLAVGLISAASFGHAQPSQGVPRIGVLDPSPSETASPRLNGLRNGLKSRGLEEGRDYVIEYRSAEGKFERLPALAADLAKLPVKVLVARNTPGVVAARAATTQIPIVMADVGDPVGTGLVQSLAKPGGNITGLSNSRIELIPKRLEYLQEVAPMLRRLAVLANPDDQNMSFQVAELRTAAGKRGIEFRIFEARSPRQIDAALQRMLAWKAQAVLPLVNPLRFSERLIPWEVQHRVPVMFGYSTDTLDGGLMAYDADLSDQYQRVGLYVGKLLAGADPATLPVERPTRFELTLNLKTAKALGIKIPQTLMISATRVFE
jgi:putative ABC transport system substrate-binding protein